MYGCPDLGARIYKLLKDFGITQAMVADELHISSGQASKLLNDKIDMPVGAFLHLVHMVKERPSAFLGEKNTPTVELLQVLRKLVQVATPMVEPAGTQTVAEETRLVRLLRVAATPDNETYDDDPEPRLYALPRDYNKPDINAFEVVGDSMSGDWIISGDIVLTRPARTREEGEGQIVVCAVNGYRHLKRLHRRRGKVLLESTAPERKMWELNQSERASFKLIGIVINETRRVAR